MVRIVIGLVAILALVWVVREVALQRCERQIAIRDYSRAQAWLTLARWTGPSSSRMRWLAARLDRKLGRMEAFADSLELAAKSGVAPAKIQLESLLAVAQSGRMDVIEAQLGMLLINHNDEASEISEAFVLGSMMNYRFAEAKKVLDIWQADYPDDPQPHYLRGRILEHDSDYERAEQEYRAAMKLQPRHAPATFNLGRLLTVRQKPAEALEVYQRGARLLAYPHAAWVGMGRSERALGHTNEARRWLQKATEGADRREVQEVYRWLGETAESARAQAAQELAQLELDQQHFAEAVQWFERAVAANPRDWKVRHGLATALRSNGEKERAVKEFAIVEEYRTAWQQIDKLFDQLQLAPQSPSLRTQIGVAFLRYYSENQGLVWLNSALSYDPDFLDAHRALADYFAAHESENPQFAKLAQQHRSRVNALSTEKPALPETGP